MAAVCQDPLKLYRTPAGYQAVMAWYESVLDDIQVPYESLYANTRFGRTHLIAAGPRDGEPLFLIPGVAGCAPLWRRQLSNLSREFRVYALDIPGQPGRSDPNPPSLLDDGYVDWLTDVIDDLGILRAHFGGVSVGAWLAMRMGIERPDRVLKVVMLGPTGLSRARLPVKTWFSRVLKGFRSTDVLENELTAKKVAGAVTRSPGAAFGTFDRQLAKAMALCTKHYRVDRSLRLYDDSTGRLRLLDALRVLRRLFLAEPEDYLRRLSVPGLVVFGQYEVLYDPHAVGRKARKLMGSLQVAVIDDAGHAAIYDRPEVVEPLIVAFLKGTAPAGEPARTVPDTDRI